MDIRGEAGLRIRELGRNIAPALTVFAFKTDADTLYTNKKENEKLNILIIFSGEVSS